MVTRLLLGGTIFSQQMKHSCWGTSAQFSILILSASGMLVLSNSKLKYVMVLSQNYFFQTLTSYWK